MGQYDYGEIICTAIDEIVTTRLQGVECDITKLCTVVDDSYSYEGKYVVSDGGARFEAYSSDSSFKNGNNVLVTIPNGDFNLQKTIVGRVATTDSTPFKYTSPLSTMLKVEDDLLTNRDFEETGLLANKNNSSTAKKHLEISMANEDINKYEGFTRLGVSADFKCLLGSQDVISGSYGLKILINADVLVSPGEVDTTTGVVELTFSSADMIGNPYYFDDYFNQEKVFDISNVSNIKSIEIYLYQNGQFKSSNGELIPWSYVETIGDASTISLLRNNIFVDNVKLYFGYELSKYTGETLEIYSTSSTNSYHYSREENSGNQKSMNLRWIHQNKDSSIKMLDVEDFNKEEYKNYEIHWFKYNYGYEDINQYAGANWEEITPENQIHSLSCSFNPDIKKQNEQIKVVGLMKELVDFNISINDFEETTDAIFYYDENNKTYWFRLKITNGDNNNFKYELQGTNKSYELEIEYDNVEKKHKYFILIEQDDKTEIKQQVYLRRNITFPISLEKYNLKIKDKSNHYLLFITEDIKVKIKKDNIDYQIRFEQIEDDEGYLVNQYYYLIRNNNTRVDLILVADALTDDLTAELANIKLGDFGTVDEYNEAINAVYEKYYGVEPELEYSIIAYFSNILIFENEEKVVDDLTYQAATALSIRCKDNSEGNYFIYDQNGKIINEGLGNGHIKYFEVLYNGQPLNQSTEIELGENDYIKWYLPFDSESITGTHTMIVKSPQLWGYKDGIYKNDANGQYVDVIYTIDGVDYIGTQRNATPKTDGGGNIIEGYYLEPEQPYMIKNYWTAQDANNIIRCEVRIKGVIYEAIEDLKFGKAGSNGTNTTLVLDMVNGQNALIVNDYENDEYQYYEYNEDNKIYSLCSHDQHTTNCSQLVFEQINDEDYKKDQFYISSNNNFVLSTTEASVEGTNYYKPVRKNILQVRAILYDINGNIIGFPTKTETKEDTTITISDIHWSWYSKSNTDYILPVLNESNKHSGEQVITLTCNINEVPDDNYFILKAECGSNPKLEAYLPIPLKTNKTSKIEGAREVLYDYQGVPSYYSQAYVLYDEDHNEILESSNNWIIKSNEVYQKYSYDEENKSYTADDNGTYLLLFDKIDNDNYQSNIYYVASDNNTKYTLATNEEPAENVEYYNCINQLMASQYQPQLASITRGSKTDYKALKAAPFYAQGPQAKVCVSCKHPSNGEVQYSWAQPILVMQNHYNFDVLNQWDGNLTLDENNGTILSTMLGAGRKNSQNQFSGVLIGDIQGGTDLDSSDEHTGVYGLHNGQLSYALRDDGTATFGKAGHGQIKIDGNSGRIYSPSYYNKKTSEDDIGTGMLIDLDDGIIDILGGAKAENPRFRLSSRNKNILINIDNDKQYLQSNSYKLDNNQGTKLDLSSGKLEIKSPYGKILLNANYGTLGDIDPYFQIAVPALQAITDEETGEIISSNIGTATDSEGYINSLFLLDSNNYYLQSTGYSGLAFKQITIEIDNAKKLKCNLYNYYQGLTLIEETIALPIDGDLTNVYEKVNNLWQIKEFKKEEIIDGNYKEIITSEQVKDGFISKLIPVYQQIKQSGLKLDLHNGIINGYDLRLTGTSKKNSKNTLVIDCSNDTTPFIIGGKTKINWDGTLTCSKVNSLNDDGRNSYAISINDNFYVTKSGSTGANSGSYGSLYAGGVNVGTSLSTLIKDIETLKRDMANHTHSVTIDGFDALNHAHIYEEGAAATHSTSWVSTWPQIYVETSTPGVG